MSKIKLTAAVRITDFRESPENAIKSVLTYPSYFTRLTIVDLAYDPETEYYEGYTDDVADLEKLHQIQVSVCDKLRVEEIDTKYILHVHPQCSFKRGALDRLLDMVDKSNPQQTDFSLASGTKLDTFSVWYGYFLFIAFWTFLWARWEHHKMSRNVDLRLQAVITQGKHSYTQPWQLRNYLFNPHVHPRETPTDMSVAIIKPEISGFHYLWSFLHNHQYFGVSWFYWIPIVRIWMLLFTVYWFWTLGSIFELSKIFVALVGWLIGTPGAVASISGIWTMVFLIGNVLSYMIIVVSSATFYLFPFQFHLIPLFPLYVLTFPLVLAYSRLVKYNKHW